MRRSISPIRVALGVGLALLFAAASLQAAPAERVLRVAVPALPALGLNPLTAPNIPPIYTLAALYDALTWVDSDGAAHPQAAERWRAESETTWVFTLRPDQVFSDGTPLDAAAVVFSVDMLRAPEGAAYTVSVDLPTLKGARALNAREVEFTTSAPNPFLPQELSIMRLMSPANWRKVGAAGINTSPVGSGPFVLQHSEPMLMLLKANPTAQRRPKVDALEIRAVPDHQARIQALLSGRIDIALALGPDHISIVEGAGHRVFVQREASMQVLVFITTKPSPLTDVRVRRALNHAVDKDRIVATILAGRAPVSTQTAPANAFGYDPELKAYAYDPDLARRLLAEAGYADGFSFTADLWEGLSSFGPLVYQQVAAELARVGVTLDLRLVPIAKFARGVQQGEWDGIAFGNDYTTLPSLDALRGFLRNSCLWKAPWYCDETIMPLLKQAMGTFDLDKRRELTKQVLRHQRDMAPGILLHDYVRFDGVAKRVKNFSIHIGFIPYEEIEVQ